MADAKATSGTARRRKPAEKATDVEDTDLGLERETPDLPVEPVAAQFPALDGTDEGRELEIARRSPDGSTRGRFVKIFHVGRLAPADDDPIHTINAVQVVQEAMQRGLHARGDVYLTGVVEHDTPLNASGTRRAQWTELTYEVDAVPASIDTRPQDTTTPKVINLARAGGDGGDGTDADDVGDTG